MKHIKLYEDFVNEAKSVNPKQKGIGKFLGSVDTIDVYTYEIFPKVLSSSDEFKDMSLDNIEAIQTLVYDELTGMHQTKLNGKPGKLIKRNLSNLNFLKSKKDGSFDKPADTKQDGGNFDKMVKNSTKDQLLRSFN
jgi:hypothetical protein